MSGMWHCKLQHWSSFEVWEDWYSK